MEYAKLSEPKTETPHSSYGTLSKSEISKLKQWRNMPEITREELCDIVRCRGTAAVAKLQEVAGDIEHLCKKLHTNAEQGLDATVEEINYRKLYYGENTKRTPKAKNFLYFVFKALQDVTVILLLVAAVITLGLSFYVPEETNSNAEASALEGAVGYMECVAIVCIALVIILATAFNNWSKEKQFRTLYIKMDEQRRARVLRNGRVTDISCSEVVVGDICIIAYGNVVPADGLLISTKDLVIDESAYTGVSDDVKKDVMTDPVLLSGSHVKEGDGLMVILAVGANTEEGSAMELLGAQEQAEASLAQELQNFVLKRKVAKVTLQIVFCGVIVSFTVLLFLIIDYSVDLFVVQSLGWDAAYLQEYFRRLLLSVSLLLCIVPEGLPLAVMLVLAYSVKRMLKEKTLVRHLYAGETVGNATTILIDKTGTLTANKMSVDKCYIAGQCFADLNTLTSSVNTTVRDLLSTSIAINTSSLSKMAELEAIAGHRVDLGDKTEVALLKFISDMGYNFKEICDTIPETSYIKVYGFRSNRKWMATVIPLSPTKCRLFIKGAPEKLLGNCQWLLDQNGDKRKLNEPDIEEVKQIIESMTTVGLRSLCLAFKDFVKDREKHPYDDIWNEQHDWENEEKIIENLTLLCAVGLEDPLRPNVQRTIADFGKAGITVRMITGDNVQTAKYIADKCGIPTDDENSCLGGNEFEKLIRNNNNEIDQELADQVWPSLRILARSDPDHKLNLVNIIMNSQLEDNQEVVAVTGDGTNDAPALKMADIGLTMGMMGTDVAREAADIILLDDNFESIISAVSWGRHIYDTVVRFIQFQITISVVIVGVTVLGLITIQDSVLKAIQLLWINLIKDVMVALSLATELPTYYVLGRKPHRRNESIVSEAMLRNVICHSVYQITVVAFVLYAGPVVFDIDDGNEISVLIPTEHYTMIFNTVVLMILFNELNCRLIHDFRNPLRKPSSSVLLFFFWILTLILQVMMVQFGGTAFGTKSLTADLWLWCFFFGVGDLLIRQFIGFIPASSYGITLGKSCSSTVKTCLNGQKKKDDKMKLLSESD